MYKLVNPYIGEENLIYIIVNHNEVTNMVIIECINCGMSINPQETVNISEIIKIKNDEYN